MPRSRFSIILATLLPLASACSETSVCTEIGCSSVAEVSYGSITVNERYELTVDAAGQKVTVICLGDELDEPPPEWLTCDAQGFTLQGPEADTTAVTVTLVVSSSGDVLIENELVSLVTEEVNQPNGPDCEPTCYERRGTVPPA